MEKMTYDSITKKLLSPNDEHEKDDNVIASTEGGSEEELSDSIQEPTLENLNQDESELAIEKVNKKCSLPNDISAWKNDFTIDASKRIQLDLNIPIIDEDEGEAIDEKVGNVESPHALGLQLDQGENEESPYELGAAESEGGISSLNKSDEKVYDFDLNVPLVDEDEDGAY
ncbi:hypothetical protein TanjilG_03789 [Lupinus angustifolius]|uniref:Uncharacterized protein n=1 Tax=Lupinus angustifolius TaxID=3871 RepID=A0A1J7H0D5_LUPAN|nr:hypothetical protein TanjilG_03789 [Lupinus angustifolius]